MLIGESYDEVAVCQKEEVIKKNLEERREEEKKEREKRLKALARQLQTKTQRLIDKESSRQSASVSAGKLNETRRFATWLVTPYRSLSFLVEALMKLELDCQKEKVRGGT